MIAEQQNIDGIRDYMLFLKPFTDNADISFCRWDCGGNTLKEAVRDLQRIVGQQRHWRAVVLCEETCITQRNPFDVVKFSEKDGIFGKGKDRKTFREEKFRAFEEAAAQPLTRLMTWLCEDPVVSFPKEGQENAFDPDSDPEYAEYLAEMKKKLDLRAEIRSANQGSVSIALPEEILCIALRTRNMEVDTIPSSWKTHLETEYSRFYDWNMYFDKMRYLIFDILPANRSGYRADRFRFLYTVIVLASHDLPGGSMQPNRVYRLICENNNEALTRIVSIYDSKLKITEEKLERIQEKIKGQKPKKISDYQASRIFTSNISISVPVHTEFDEKDLTMNPRKIGLADGCPSDEYGIWQEGYDRARNKLAFARRLPKRVIRKAAYDMRALDSVDTDHVHELTEFQVSDIKNHIGQEEMAMAGTVPQLMPAASGEEKLEESDRTARRMIGTRMNRKKTIGLGVLMLALFAAGSLPFLINNGPGRSLSGALCCILAGAAAVAACGFFCLLFLRSKITGLMENFNTMVLEVCHDMEQQPKKAGTYLSHACSVMRGYSALKYLREHESPKEEQLKILQKHRDAIQSVRADLREMFPDYISELPENESREIQPYDYNYRLLADFRYPVPYTANMKKDIEFIRKGSFVTVPVEFIKKISVRREELYDD